MLESLSLRSFQTHRNKTIRFDPGITVLIGPNDAGKTSILRALRWLVFNRPSGTQFITNPKLLEKGSYPKAWRPDYVRVEAIFDGRKVVRRRGKGQNLYLIDGKKFAAVKTDVPREVNKLINLNAFNFQDVLDSVFLLRETPGQASRTLNAVVNLGVIDKTLSFVHAESRRAEVALTIGRERLKRARDTRKSLAWVPALQAEVTRLQARESSIKSLKARESDLSDLIKRAKAQRRAIRRATEAHQAMAGLVRRVERLTATERRETALAELIESIETADKLANQSAININPLLERVQRLAETTERLDALTTIITTAEREREKECCAKQKLARIQKSLARVAKCPACLRPTK